MNRNETITVAILRGWTLLQVAMIFNITPERVRQIVAQTIRKNNKNFYYSVKLGSVREYRRHKNN